MHPKFATLMLLSGAALLFSACETTGPQATTAPPPSPYETLPPPAASQGTAMLQPGAPGAVSAPAPSQPPRPVRARVVEHKVGTGESLWSISRKYESTVGEIREANQITGDLIRAGQTLKVPTSMPEEELTSQGASAAPLAPAPQAAAELPPSTGLSRREDSTSWTVTPPVTPPTSSTNAAPQYRIPEPVILPPPGEQ